MIIFTSITDTNNNSYDVETSMILNTMMEKMSVNYHTEELVHTVAKAKTKAKFFSQLKFAEFPY